MPVIVPDANRRAHRLERETIARKDYLQQYIHDNPESLPVAELDAAGRLLALQRESPTGRGPMCRRREC